MMKSYVYSNFSVPNTDEGVNNEVGWEFFPEYHKRKIPSKVYLNKHFQKKMNKLCVKTRSFIDFKTNYC